MNRLLVGVMGVLLGGIATACYSPSFSDCALRCSAAGTCPDGTSCDGQFCRSGDPGTSCSLIGIDAADDSMTIDGPPGDRDGDTIGDARDNCPDVANVNQDNEDGDVFGDICDPCPPFAGVANIDSDGDGVGNGCDPNPNMVGDSIAVFEGFNRQPGTNVVTSGNISYAGGQLVIVGSPPSSVVTGSVLWTGPVAQTRVLGTRILVDEYIPGAGGFNRTGIGVIERFSMPNQSGVWCGVGSNPNLGPEQFIDEAPSIPLSTNPSANAITMVELAFRRTGDAYECVYTPPGNRIIVQTTINSGMSPTMFGIRSSGVSAHVPWFMAVTRPTT